MESRNALRAHGFAIAFYMTLIGIGFLRGKPMLGTKPLYEALDDVAAPVVWGIILTSLGLVRLLGIVLAWQKKDNPRPNLFSAATTGISAVLWAFMAFVYFTIAEGGSSLTLLAILDATTCIYSSRMTGTASGRRLIGRTIGD